jgi:hypothetical protein
VDENLEKIEHKHIMDCNHFLGFERVYHNIHIKRVFNSNQTKIDVSQSQAFVDLHQKIETYDQVLCTMAQMLTGYQVTLGKISEEIQVLQDQSQLMGLKLKNRQVGLSFPGILFSRECSSLEIDHATKSERGLRGNARESRFNQVSFESIYALNETYKPHSLKICRKICQGEVNEFYLSHLTELNKKMAYVKTHQSKNVKAFKDLGPELERLRLKAAYKSREFLLKKIEALKSTQSNISIVQLNVLLKYKELYAFLTERYSEAAIEVRQTYVTLANSYFSSLFDRYVKGLSRLQVHMSSFLVVDEC